MFYRRRLVGIARAIGISSVFKSAINEISPLILIPNNLVYLQSIKTAFRFASGFSANQQGAMGS